MLMRNSVLAGLALAMLPASAPAWGEAVLLDPAALAYEVAHVDGRKAYLAEDARGRPITELVRLPRGGVMPPHRSGGGLKLLTVLEGDLSWGDGDRIDPARERILKPGSVIVIPPDGGAHWHAARSGDVVFQVVFVRDGRLTPQIAAQTGS